jgi:hypothetical protein
MFSRVKLRDTKRTIRNTPDNVNFQEVLYADDTILISTSTNSMNHYLNLVEEESYKMGLKLNKAKCRTICRTRRSYIKFANGEVVKKSESAEYLGVLLNSKAAIEEKLEARLRKAAVTWRRLKPYWRGSNASRRKKILMWNALIKTRVIYGLESAELKTRGLEKLNTFQLKGLRQILRMVTTFVDRTNTNTRVLEEATKAVNTSSSGMVNNGRGVELLSETHTQRRIKLAGRVLRLADNDARRFTTYHAGSGRVKKKLKKRTGRPKINWGDVTHARIWERIRDELGEQEEIGDPHDAGQQDWIRDAATLGMF